MIHRLSKFGVKVAAAFGVAFLGAVPIAGWSDPKGAALAGVVAGGVAIWHLVEPAIDAWAEKAAQ